MVTSANCRLFCCAVVSMIGAFVLSSVLVGCGSSDSANGRGGGDAVDGGGTVDGGTAVDGGGDGPGTGGTTADGWDGTLPEQEPAFWPLSEPPGFSGDFMDEHDDLIGRLSRWSTHVTADTRPGPGQLGAFGVGNGHVFAFVGYADPLSTLHSMVGPTYERHDGFFGDYVVALETPEGRLEFEEEWAGLSVDTPVSLTRGRAGHVMLDTLDFAPWTEGPERSCIVRVLTVQNPGGTVDGLRLVIDPFRTVTAEGHVGVETQGTRHLATGFADGGGEWVDGILTRSVGDLTEGDFTATLLHCAADGEPPTLPDDDVVSWLAATRAAYREWEFDMLVVEAPDPMVQDFVDGMKRTLITQTAASGGSAPMSQYTRTWARDNIGPALAWIALGGFTEARAMIDYVYGAILIEGDLANSYPVDLDVSDPPPPPDWGAMAPLSGRVGAETPSYMVWMYTDYVRATGDTSVLDERWGFLERCLFAQDFTEDDLLPFTDDETFRAAMNVAAGLFPEYPHLERSLSANSSFLWLGAARGFIEAAERIGRDAAAERARAMYADVEFATLDTYLLADGCFASFVDRESGDRFPPFEDVATKVTWAGWLDGDDPTAAASIECLLDRFAVRPGVVRSPVHEDYDGVAAFSGGVYTGMLPGYTLSALTEVGHPAAADAFRELATHVSTSGNFQEYYDAGTEDGLQLLYDPSGEIGDYTAKFRPWEGGINLRAVIDYLTGWDADATTRTIAIRPHLPPGWPSMTIDPMMVQGDPFVIQVDREDDGVTLTFRPGPVATGYKMTLRWDHFGPPVSLSIDGEAVAESTLTRRTHFGQASVETSPIPLEAGQTVTVRITQ